MSGNFLPYGKAIAIDLGTANTIIQNREGKILLNEPSIVSIDETTGGVVCVGREAREMLGKAPRQVFISPLKDGVIADFDACAKMLREFMLKVNFARIVRPRTAICVPVGITPVERRAVTKVAENAGAKKGVYVIEEPVAAAIGAGLPIHTPTGNMIVDIGGGTTEVAVMSTGGMVTSKSVPVAGNAFDEAIIQYLKKEWDFTCSNLHAEKLKHNWTSVWPLKEEKQLTVKGRNLKTGYPGQLELNTAFLREAVEVTMLKIMDAISETLDNTPPELVADIMEKGITMAGGGCLMHGMVERIQHETGVNVWRAKNPEYAVVRGCAQSLSYHKTFSN